MSRQTRALSKLLTQVHANNETHHAYNIPVVAVATTQLSPQRTIWTWLLGSVGNTTSSRTARQTMFAASFSAKTLEIVMLSNGALAQYVPTKGVFRQIDLHTLSPSQVVDYKKLAKGWLKVKHNVGGLEQTH